MTLFQLLERECGPRGLDLEIKISTKELAGRVAEVKTGAGIFDPKPPELEFPIAPNFVPEPPHLDPVAMYWRCEELVRQNARKHDARRRTFERLDVEFVM